MKRYKNLYNEELLDGYVKGERGSKVLLRRIESLKEYKNTIKNNREARGVIFGNNFYLVNSYAEDVVHLNILHSLKIYRGEYPYGGYDEFIDKFLLVHVNRRDGKVWIGGSYSYAFRKREIDLSMYFKVLDKLNIPYEIKFVV